MKMILQRKDQTSIYCPPVRQAHTIFRGNTRYTQFTIASTLIIIGLFLIILF